MDGSAALDIANDITTGLVQGASFISDDFIGSYLAAIFISCLGIAVGFVAYKLIKRALNKA